ncbi:Golgi transport complex subunit COG3 [Pneumocystis jirovecii RU7]|uniref:Conserved oligomeric Golgi complex subunit 3 n=1 Tax=Pneumocystis jirovecii (strain RU7) TaxID=1408657 RepID=A0A0W4ZFR4_PNEJ7|nr:Golgi transport complex subunit COG3 [Pneumocystis jirovecii RU7]KTW27227.1 hypothetical protein T551_03221 [Pneumocystis jirovecii RU7]
MTDKNRDYLALEKDDIANNFRKNISYSFGNKYEFQAKKISISRSFSLNDLKKVQEIDNISQIHKNINYHASLVLFDEIEKSLENQQNLCFRLLKKEYLKKLSISENLMTQVSNILEKLELINNDVKNACKNSYNFRIDYEKLIKEEQNMIILDNQITENLEVYDSLDMAFKLLNTSGIEFIKKPEFFNILKKLDKGLLMMKKHPEYKDSKMYSIKFKQCLTKAMTLICIFFVQIMKELNDEIDKNTSYKESDNIIQSALLYRKFHVRAFQLKPYIKEIELRVKDHDEYHILINDCENSYLGIRYRLINRIILEKLNKLSSNKNVIVFTRLSITFFQSLCLDEFSLFQEFFENEYSKFYHFSQKLFKPISTYLQSKLDNEPKLLLYCDILSIIKTQLFQDTENEILSDTYSDSHKLDFTIIFSEIIQILESRIVLEVRNIAILEIQNFIPTKNDFSLFKNLEKNDKSNSLPTEMFDIEKETLFNNVSITGWYPTLNKTISLLSKIYPILNNESFTNVAYDIIKFCISSLIRASKVQTDISIRDSQLFLIKHLLILRDQVLEFNVNFFRFESEKNISTATTNSMDTYNKTQLFSPLEFCKSTWTKISRFSSNEKDVFTEFNSVLQTAINTSIEHSLKPFMESIQKIQNIKNPSNDVIQAKISESLVLIEKEAPILKHAFLNYIENFQIIHIFFTEIIKEFSKKLDKIKEHLPSQSLTTWSQTNQLISYLTNFLLSGNTIENL